MCGRLCVSALKMRVVAVMLFVSVFTQQGCVGAWVVALYMRLRRLCISALVTLVCLCAHVISLCVFVEGLRGPPEGE